MGIEIAGVPSADQGAFIAGSPVVDKPKGAGPVAAGVRITGVDLKISAILTLLSETNFLASSYCWAGIFRPSRTRVATGWARRSPHSFRAASWDRAPS